MAWTSNTHAHPVVTLVSLNRHTSPNCHIAERPYQVVIFPWGCIQMGTRLRFRLLLVVALPLLLGASVTHGRDGLLVLTVSAVSTALVAWFFVARPAQREIAILQGARQQLAESHSASVDDLKRERDLLGSILETMQDGVLLLDG